MSIIDAKCNFPSCDNKEWGLNAIQLAALESLFRLIAADGMVLWDLSAGEYNEHEFYGFIPHSDDVELTQLTIAGGSVLIEMGLDGETLTTADPAIMAPFDKTFDSINGTVGKVWLLLKLC